MHKNFAKTLFAGKNTEYLTQCHSTNDLLMERVKRGVGFEGDLVVTDFQSKGRGQRGNTWESESGQNLLFSLLLKPGFLSVQKLYFINVIAGLAMHEAVARLAPGLYVEIKWPNDIYINDKKVAGVLVETVLSGAVIECVIVGIGFNLNQSHFLNPQASSLSSETGQRWSKEEVLEEILLCIESNYLLLQNRQYGKVMRKYHDNLRWRGEQHTFKAAVGEFQGEIIGLNEVGSLVVKVGDRLETFEVKELTFIE